MGDPIPAYFLSRSSVLRTALDSLLEAAFRLGLRRFAEGNPARTRALHLTAAISSTVLGVSMLAREAARERRTRQAARDLRHVDTRLRGDAEGEAVQPEPAA
jgi:hypothetical protein